MIGGHQLYVCEGDMYQLLGDISYTYVMGTCINDRGTSAILI